VSYKDKNKQRKYQKAWARRHVQVRLDRHLRYKEEYEEYMTHQKCSKCSESHVACLEWHHLDPKQKKYDISSKKARAPLSTLMREINKCVCLCRNCHSKLHYEMRQSSLKEKHMRT